MVASKDKELDKALRKSIENTIFHMKKIVDSANNGITYDMLIERKIINLENYTKCCGCFNTAK